MAIERRRLDPHKVFVPPENIKTSEDISREHQRKVFKTGTDILGDAVKLLDKHLDHNKKALYNQVNPQLDQMLKSFTAQERVQQGITKASLLRNALKNDDEMLRFRQLTGVTASKGDLKFIFDAIKQGDAATPVMNHLQFMKELVLKHGGAKLEKGQLVKNDIPKLFKDATGKDIYSLLPKNRIKVELESQFRHDSGKILTDAVGSGSLSYKQGIEEAGKALGVGSVEYEAAKTAMFNAMHARMSKLHSLENMRKEKTSKALYDGPFSVEAGLPEDAKPADRNTYERGLSQYIKDQVFFNQNPNKSLGAILDDVELRAEDAPYVTDASVGRARDYAEGAIRKEFDAGLEVLVPRTRGVVGGGTRAKDRAQAAKVITISQDERRNMKRILLPRYFRLRSMGNSILGGRKDDLNFFEMTETQRGQTIKRVQDIVQQNVREIFGPNIPFSEEDFHGDLVKASRLYGFDPEMFYKDGFYVVAGESPKYADSIREELRKKALKEGEERRQREEDAIRESEDIIDSIMDIDYDRALMQEFGGM